jgi:hypothetical protein
LVAIGFLDDMTVRDDKDNNLEGLDKQGATFNREFLINQRIGLRQSTSHANNLACELLQNSCGSKFDWVAGRN